MSDASSSTSESVSESSPDLEIIAKLGSGDHVGRSCTLHNIQKSECKKLES